MKLKPKKRDRDCWDHFSMRYRCPACDTALTSYDYGRAWCPNGLREDQLIDCPECGQEIDWSEEPRAREIDWGEELRSRMEAESYGA